jgi:hypothetical protein
MQVVLMKINNHCGALIYKLQKRQHIYSSTEDSEVLLAFEHNNAGLRKLLHLV